MQCCLRSIHSLQRDQRCLWALYWHSVLLVHWNIHVYAMGTASSSTEQFTLLSWPATEKTPDQKEEERKEHSMLIMGLKQKYTEIQPFKLWELRAELRVIRGPVLTVAYKAYSWQHTNYDPRYSTNSSSGKDSCRNGHGTGSISSQKITTAGGSSS